MKQTEPKQPFFARFLESHNKQEQPASQPLTDPWPFPVPTSPMKDPITEKWPSDGDDEF